MSALDYPFANDGPLTLGPTHARLRQERGLARVRMPYGGDAWLATRYRDVRQVLSDPDASRVPVEANVSTPANAGRQTAN